MLTPQCMGVGPPLGPLLRGSRHTKFRLVESTRPTTSKGVEIYKDDDMSPRTLTEEKDTPVASRKTINFNIFQQRRLS